MRTLFQNRQVQERVKEVFRNAGYGNILRYWNELLDFFSQEENVFDDVLDLLTDDYNIVEDDAIELYESLYEALEPYQKELQGFFEKTEIEPSEVQASEEEDNRRVSPPSTTPLKKEQAPNKGRADFYFSPEDEEEIKEVLRQAQDDIVGRQQKMEGIYQRVAGEVIQRLRGTGNAQRGAEDEERERRRKRLSNIIIARLKDARDVLETKEALGKPWKVGGMEFANEDAERVLREIEKAREALGQELKLLNATMHQSANVSMKGQGASQSFQQSYAQNLEELSEPEIEGPGDHVSRNMEHVTTNTTQDLARQNQDKILPTTHYPLPTSSQKPAVDSVASAFPPAFGKQKLMGPVEELAALTLEDFRRLGNTVDAVRKLHDKIELLAADSLLEKKKGIDAWKRSEVYRLYLLMGTESLEKREGVGNIISLRQQQGVPVLTLEEFSAVADLNRKISFSS